MDKKFVDYTYEGNDYSITLAANNKFLVVCQCGHYEMLDSYTLEWKCPHCGNVVHTEYYCTSSVDNYVRPYKARIFYNEDGSMSIGLIKKHRYACITKEGNGICRIRYSVQRFIFHRNGQTYIKNSVYTDTKRPVHPNMPRFFTATYKSDYLPYEIGKLFSEDLLINDIVLKNRFRKLDVMYDAITNLTNIGIEEDYSYGVRPNVCRRVRNLLASIKPEATDIEAYQMLLKHCGIKGGKKLKRLFAVSPYKAFVTAMDNEMYVNLLSCRAKYLRILADTIMEKYGEHSLLHFIINAIEKNPRMAEDTADFMYNVSNIIPMEEIKEMITNNLHETHDIFMERNRLFNSHNVGNCGDIISNNEKLKTTTDYLEQKSLKLSNISFIQKVMNFDIDYNEKEMELEGEYNGVQFVLPKDTDSLIKVGDKMRNCVGTNYRILALNKECIIVVMKQNQKYVGCIELTDGVIKQAYAPCNNELHGEYLKAFNLWKKSHDIQAYRYGILCHEC